VLPGPLRPELRWDPVRRRRLRRSWLRAAPVAVPLLLLCVLLPRWDVAARPGDAAPGAEPVGTAGAAPAAGAHRLAGVPDGHVVVAVTPVEPAVLAVLAVGDRVHVHGPAVSDDTGSPDWLAGTAPVRLLASAAVVVGVPPGPSFSGGPDPPVPVVADPAGPAVPVLPGGSLALAVTAAEAQAVAEARGSGLSVALLLTDAPPAG
jgi:hypothetical protein